MKHIATNLLASGQEQLSKQPYEILGFDKAAVLLIPGVCCMLLVLIFGIILCRLDMSAGKRHRSIGLYIEN